MHREILGRGAAYGDIVGDGDQDVVVTENAGPAYLLRNDQELGHHWLRVVLKGKPSNTCAIGATARLKTTDGQVQTLTVMPGRSYLSQVELPLTFGLGTDRQIDELEITWPDGSRQQIHPDRMDVQITVDQSP